MASLRVALRPVFAACRPPVPILAAAAARRPAFCAAFGRSVRGFATASDVADRADGLIKDHGCVIFSKSTCPYCAMAKGVVTGELKAKAHVMEMDAELRVDEMTALQDHFQKLTGARSVPRVFIGGKCVGGGSDVAELHEKGELRPMLEKAGAL
mmetsp:Transcript_59400/g.150757  ORF Transcript_59400/g.150757 Transcript_59400/m.150757 type:complete len:154 (+) Transcript_59400:81-542(+)